MGSYKELYQRVMLRLDVTDGRAFLAAKLAVNDAQKAIARVQEFDELFVDDKTNAKTVAETSEYDPSTDWGLVRLKDIHSLRVIDSMNSAKLIWVSPREIDKVIPYPDLLGSGWPKWYTKKAGKYVLYPTPSDAWDLYILYTQWPLILSDDDDESQLEGIDDVIIDLASEMAEATLTNTSGVDWVKRAEMLIRGAAEDREHRPDRTFIAQAFNPKGSQVFSTEPWNDPFVKSNR